jgi:hypothetical protein
VRRNPDKDERQSIANAAQLVREAGWREKAAILDCMLQRREIKVDPDMSETTYASAFRIKGLLTGRLLFKRINLNPDKVKLKTDSRPPKPIERNTPEMVVLAGTIMHEADHILCHDELEAYGEEIAFYKALNREFEKHFGNPPAEEKAKIEEKKKKMEEEAERIRKKIAERGGRGYGNKESDETQEESDIEEELQKITTSEKYESRTYPDEPISEVEQQMEKIANAIFNYKNITGHFPSGKNIQLSNALKKLNLINFKKKELNKEGQIVDPWGFPFVYVVPGKIFRDEFDLYSLGPHGKDEGGKGENILCELHRR